MLEKHATEHRGYLVTVERTEQGQYLPVVLRPDHSELLITRILKRDIRPDDSPDRAMGWALAAIEKYTKETVG
jgi:hypothetical protein